MNGPDHARNATDGDFWSRIDPLGSRHYIASMPVVHGVHHDTRPGFGLGSVKCNRHVPGTSLIMRHPPATGS